jgi:2',3'-cyclic-nucleotide 2'-phosphodiesterase/3'-nucleotidase
VVSGRFYTVQPCDNLYRIGLAYGLSWVVIAQANGLPNANVIYPGQVLVMPGR